MSRETIRVIGAGSGKRVYSNRNEYQIYCNASVIRAEDHIKLHDCIFLTDGILLTDQELRQFPNASGLNEAESLNMRKAKRLSMYGRHASELFVVSNRPLTNVIRRIEAITLSYDRLEVLNSHDRSLLLFRYMGLHTIPVVRKFGYKPMLFYVLSVCLPIKFRPPVSVRPSTGMVAYLWSVLHKGSEGTKIVLDGIGNSLEAYYPSCGKLKGEIFTFNRIHKIDRYIYRKYKNNGLK